MEFFLPGGALALLSLAIAACSVALFCQQTDSIFFILLYIAFLLSASLITVFLALKSIRKSGKKDSFFLQKDQEGFSSDKIEEDLVGKEGIVVTELKPAGHVRIEGRLYQAVSSGQFVVKGTLVEVMQVKGFCLIVKSKM
jgi:membrane-bound serine protease (ClpP class)